MVSLIVLVALLAGCAPPAASPVPRPEPSTLEIDEATEAIWASTVEPYLQDPLWTDRDIYDAGHELVPALEAAFRGGQTDWQNDFADHFARFMAAEEAGDVSEQRLWRLHYFYLASHFLNLASTYGRTDIIPDGLPEFLTEDLRSIWFDQDAIQWESDPFRGIKARVEWKLDNRDPDPGYFRAMTDEELFSFAIAADLRVYEREAGADFAPVVEDVLGVAARVLEQESSYPDDGWLFQVGVWSDYPDYAFAGVTSKTEEMVAKPRVNVATDTSHAARWPMWLASLRESSDIGSDQYEMYDDILNRLGNQFAEHMMILPTPEVPYLRMTNYMDGWNGLFRWNYATVAAGDGYEAFELSGSLLVVWWGMLADERVNAAFCELGNSFPLPDEAIELYVGPNTTRERNPLVAWPAYFTNGFAEFNVRLMCDLSS